MHTAHSYNQIKFNRHYGITKSRNNIYNMNKLEFVYIIMMWRFLLLSIVIGSEQQCMTSDVHSHENLIKWTKIRSLFFSNIYLNTHIMIPKYTNDSLCRSNNEQKKSTFNFYFRNIVIHIWEKIRHLTYEQTKYLFNFYYITTKMVVFSTYFTDHSTVNYCFWASNKNF